MSINRQQFNKYLSGSMTPSVRNMKKIADFFGMTESELLLTNEEFAALLLSKSGKVDHIANTKDIQKVLSAFTIQQQEAQNFLKKYCGHYFCYNINPVWQDHITKCVIQIYQDEGYTFWKTFEKLAPEENTSFGEIVVKQRGLVTYNAERIIVIEGSYYPAELTHGMTILYTNYRSELKYLSGLFISITTSGLRRPYSARLVLEYLGMTINESEIMKKAGVFSKDAANHIHPNLLERITNVLDYDHQTLMPVDF